MNVQNWNYLNKKTSVKTEVLSGELGIRTPGPVTVNSFQDCRNRPLCQLSAAKIRLQGFYSKSFTKLFIRALYLLQPQGPLTQQ